MENGIIHMHFGDYKDTFVMTISQNPCVPAGIGGAERSITGDNTTYQNGTDWLNRFHILLLIRTQFLYMVQVLIAALAIYCVVMVSFFLMGTPPLWACIFGVIAAGISYGLKLK